MPTNKQLQVCETSALGTVETSSTPGQHRFKVKIIEGDRWGSSGYYPATVLKSDGPKVFTEGTQMYLNHPSYSDEWDQPERKVQDIIGVLSSDATYDEATKALYAEATVFSHYAAMVQEIAPHVGMSIRAYATADEGEMDGQYGDIITGFIKAESVDLVTRAGAGGAIVGVIESAFKKTGNSGQRPAPQLVKSANEGSSNKETNMADSITPEQAKALTDAMTGLTTALTQEAAARKAAQEAAEAPEPIDPLAVAQAITESGLPTVMHADVTNAVRAGQPVAEAVAATKARYDAIVAEAKGTKTPATAPVVAFTAPAGTGTVGVSEADRARYASYLLGK